MGFITDMYTKYRELILYGIYGVLTTLVTWVSYAIFVNLGMELNLGNILSWICGVAFAFVTNKWFVFESKSLKTTKVLTELSLFVGARIFTGVIAWILFPILLWLGMDQMLFGTEGFVAKIVVSVIEIVLNWVLSKYMVFRKKKPEQTKE
ncbi:MAG: GtrA family protein [Thermoplasmata archaeon]|nr:GtrA family protein [Thermoplasmata archaeon]